MIAQLNRLEAWLERTKSKIHLIPLRLAGYLFLFVVLMVSNLIALFRWPFAALRKSITQQKNDTGNRFGEKAIIEADGKKLDEILHSRELVLVDFWAEWCGPCIMMNKPLKRLAESEDINCTIVKIDTVKHSDITGKYKVKGLPTLLLFRNYKEVKRYAGALSYPELKSFIID